MMKKIYALFAILSLATVAQGQFLFDPTIETDFAADTVLVPPSPLKTQVLFVGSTDMVQTTDTYGNPATEVPAKEWHDFIGFTPDPNSDDLGWITVNHEQVITNDNIGDGGGMTVFKVRRDPAMDTLIVVEQTLSDGRSGKYFNIDFVNTVGETGMNCGGITGPDGRIWTAEEWMRYSNEDIYNSQFGDPGGGLRDTLDFTISSDFPFADGQTIKKYKNFNWMVEVDPKEAVAVRKQYNWGRNSYEGGAIMADNQTVYIGADDTPGYLTKFVAETPGDFVNGRTFVYKEHSEGLKLSHFSTVDENFPEISAYDADNQRIFSTNTDAGVTVYDVSDPRQLREEAVLDMSAYGGEVTSVAAHEGLLAVAIPAETKTENGHVVLVDENLEVLESYEAGALPDMVCFSPDGRYVLVANEGEPNDDYDVDPDGSVTILDLNNGPDNADVHQVTFDGVDAADIPDVRIFGNGNTTDVAADLEPEYIAVTPDSRSAVVALQENNALAWIDIASGEIEKIVALGYKDHSVVPIDPSDKDGIKANLRNWNNLYGMYNPDAIAVVELDGENYIITTNEGDARDYDGYSEEERVNDLALDPTAFPDAADLQKEENLGRLQITLSQGDTDGDGDFDELYCYGGRSFSIWDWDGNQVFDSGTDFAEIVKEMAPDNYDEGREDNKGAEPESVSIGVFGGETYAFIGLERFAGVMVYNINNPEEAEFVQYYNKDGVDLSPEGLAIISAEESPDGNPYLISTNESDGDYHGTVSLYSINGLDDEKWVEINNQDFDKMLNFKAEAAELGATMYNRLEWLHADSDNDAVYISETGRDNPAGRWIDEAEIGAQYAAHHLARAAEQGVTVDSSAYWDYYGRVLKLDVSTDELSVHLEAGPHFSDPDVEIGEYPDIHLSNPDGLGGLKVHDHNFLIIQEDLNGTSYGRLPSDVATGAICEMYLLDLSIENPTTDDLVRVAVTPLGAEITGGTSTPDGKTLLLNSQHPATSHPFPYNHSLTLAVTGWDEITTALKPEFNPEGKFSVFPNPVSRTLQLNEIQDVAIYDMQGKRLKVYRDTKSINLSEFNNGLYFIQNDKGQVKKIVIQK